MVVVKDAVQAVELLERKLTGVKIQASKSGNNPIHRRDRDFFLVLSDGAEVYLGFHDLDNWRVGKNGHITPIGGYRKAM